MKFILEGCSWIAVRPSGTEPKYKLYFGVVDKTKDAAQHKLEQMKRSVLVILK